MVNEKDLIFSSFSFSSYYIILWVRLLYKLLKLDSVIYRHVEVLENLPRTRHVVGGSCVQDLSLGIFLLLCAQMCKYFLLLKQYLSTRSRLVKHF
jgi:hypothetical protein